MSASKSRADFNRRHGFRETPDMLGREVVPVVWGTLADPRCKPGITDANYIMSSRHVPCGNLTDTSEAGGHFPRRCLEALE